MYKIKGLYYRTDFDTVKITKEFESLNELEIWLRDISHDFSDSENSFPRRTGDEAGPQDYSWVGNRGLQVYIPNGTHPILWIHQISTEKGVVFESKDYCGRQFCSKNIERWLLSCYKVRENPFVED